MQGWALCVGVGIASVALRAQAACSNFSCPHLLPDGGLECVNTQQCGFCDPQCCGCGGLAGNCFPPDDAGLCGDGKPGAVSGGDAGPSDAGAGADAGTAGPPDSGTADGSVPDGGATDSGTVDGGAPDGGVADAGLDASVPSDGGARDAGFSNQHPDEGSSGPHLNVGCDCAAFRGNGLTWLALLVALQFRLRARIRAAVPAAHQPREREP